MPIPYFCAHGRLERFVHGETEEFLRRVLSQERRATTHRMIQEPDLHVLRVATIYGERPSRATGTAQDVCTFFPGAGMNIKGHLLLARARVVH